MLLVIYLIWILQIFILSIQLINWVKKNQLNEFKQSRPFLISMLSSVHEGTAWENLRKLYKPETQSKISSNCTPNINRPSTLEEVVNRKENIVGWIVKRRQIRKFTHALGEVLFHYVIFCNKENRHFSSKIYRVFSAEFP